MGEEGVHDTPQGGAGELAWGNDREGCSTDISATGRKRFRRSVGE